MKITVFDTETTGLIPKNIKCDCLNENDLENCPYIIQFSFINYNVEDNSLIEYKDNYVSLQDNVEIPIQSTNIHGITKKIIEKKGENIEFVIENFIVIYTTSTDILIGHNVIFDIKMLLIETMRLFIKTKNNKWLVYYNLINNGYCNEKTYCTMKKSVNLCNIYIKNKYGNMFKKYPKLSELYFHLFDENPKNLHNSIIDCFCCLRCYIKMVYNYDIIRKNKTAKLLFNLLT